MAHRNRFTLIDMLVLVAVLLVVTLLVIYFLPAITHPHRGPSARVKCARNLNSLGKALAMYAADNLNETPALRPAADFTAQPRLADSRAALEQQGACIAQSWWLLTDIGVLSERTFECPCDGGYRRADAPDDAFGFPDERCVSYGLQPTTRDESINVAWPGVQGQSPGVIVAGDRPVAGLPGGFLLGRHSPNHGGEGGNMLHNAGNVSWNDSDADGGAKNQIGWGDNNIYSADLDENGKRTRNGKVLVHPNDSLLYTTRTD